MAAVEHDDFEDERQVAEPDEEPELSPEQVQAAAWDKCKELAKVPRILEVFDRMIRANGFAGDTGIPQVVYLVATSRLLDKPASLIVKGESAAGKNTAVQAALKRFPDEACIVRTDASPKALYYSQESFEHRMIVLYEADALAEGQLAQLVRTLLSEGRLLYEFTDFENRCTQVIDKPGPTGLISTTTRPMLDAELETRVFSMEVTADPEQTREVMLAHARAIDGSAKTQPRGVPEWQALQTWLELGPRKVLVPFAETIAEQIDPTAVRLRRDYPTLMTLVQAHALLHRASRTVNAQGEIVATVDEDYAGVYWLTHQQFAETIGTRVQPEVMETVEVLDDMLQRSGSPHIGATIEELASELGVHRSTASRRLAKAECEEYVGLAERGARPKRWVVVSHPLTGQAALPDPAVVRAVQDDKDR